MGDLNYVGDHLSYQEFFCRPTRNSRAKFVEPMFLRLVQVERNFTSSAAKINSSLSDYVKEPKNGGTSKRKFKTLLFTETYKLESCPQQQKSLYALNTYVYCNLILFRSMLKLVPRRKGKHICFYALILILKK